MDLAHFVVGLGSLIAGYSEIKKGIGKDSFSGFGNFSRQTGKGKLPPLPSVQDIKENNQQKYKATIRKVGNIDSRVKYIVDTIKKGRVDPRIRAFAVSAVSQKCGGKWCVNERDWWGEIKALFGSVRQNIRYVRDIYRLDTFQAPARTLEFAGGDCDDYTITLGSALQSIGYPIKIRIMQSNDAPDFNHIILLVGLPPREPNRWYALDASLNKPAGWHPPKSMIQRIKDYDIL